MLKEEPPFGLYHIANEGQGTLYDLMMEVAGCLGISSKIERASLNDFPGIGNKNTVTPLKMTKTPPLRPWKEAVAAYCQEFEN